MEKLLVICDSEKLYGKRLYEYLQRRQDNNYTIKLYTSVPLMCESLKDRSISILMIDEISYAELTASEGIKKLNIGKTKILTSKRPGPGFVAEESIYKYQSAKELFNTIAQECSQGMQEASKEAKKKLTP